MMNMNFKEIHIGNFITQKVTENGIEMSRICNFFNSSEVEVLKMYQAQSLETELLLRWSKLLKYDFFRIYSQHLILYSPPSAKSETAEPSSLPVFRKNIYTKEIIEFILEEIDEGKITKNEAVDKYRIPKTTLYKWIEKYKTG